VGDSLFRITKLDDEKMQAFGWASVSVDASGEDVVDSQDDVIGMDALEPAVYSYVLRNRSGASMHEEMDVARLIESMVFTEEKIKALGLPKDTPQGWFVGFKIDDPAVWKRVRDGELRSFSIGGRARRVKVED
jgi:hypothetical protein